jgi:hypothetical protein
MAKDKGLGDSVARITKVTGIDKVAKKVAKTMGVSDCGCKKRQEALNEAVPYKK